ncbi:MAG: tetratricopeptide repeat protein [Bacteroidia bacterium]|nr:tetratricopeptide repeat protein [Bacteroidia bacterium]
MNKVLLLKRILALCSLVLLQFNLSFGQQTVGKETLGIDYFQQGNFEKALPIFAKLAQSYPDNAMYNYYYGVSLIKNNIFETAAKEALLNSVVDKTPVNANFYLAIYFHALGQWEEAKDFYDRYAKIGSKQEKRSLQYDYYVGLCETKTNPFKPRKLSDTGLFGDSILKPPPKIDEKIFPIPEALKKSSFNFQVNELLAYHSIEDFRSEASKILFTKAWMCTGKNDSILALTDSLRKVHDRITRVDTRLGMVQQIVDCEQKSFQLMRDREKYLEQSRVKESAFWEREGRKAATAYNATILERENKLNEDKKKAEKPSLTVPETGVKKDTVKVEPEKIVVPAETPANNPHTEILVYKVQIGAFKNGAMSSAFKQAYAKISKLRKIDKYTDERKYVLFTVGLFTNFRDASRMKDQLIREGMKNSVVVIYDKTTGKPAKSLTVSSAKKNPEQIISSKSVETAVGNLARSATNENLVFKVQIGSFRNDLQSTAFRKAYLRISKLMKVDRHIDSRNNVMYTVGNITNYQDVCKLRDQMISEGIKDAFVAAFLNGQRIKVKEALIIAGGK